MSVIISGTDGVTFNDTSLQGAAASPYVLKNRIINGAMIINQRAWSGTIATDGQYSLDRWQTFSSVVSKYSVSQNAGSVTPPAGYINYLGVTSLATTTVGASDYYFLRQCVEGFNITDLGWGAAGAATVTLSFWVRSSLTGTFGGTLENSAQNRSYPFSYTISVANTWEQKSITVAGDTTGTWLTTNGIGIMVQFGLGVGSTYSATANAWTATASAWSATGATNVVSTNGATFYITGVQLEVGSTATPFERRLYNQELANCQRYYSLIGKDSTNAFVFGGYGLSGNTSYITYTNPVTMRTNPTVTAVGTFYTSLCGQPSVSGTAGATSIGLQTVLTSTGNFVFASSTTSYFTVSAEL